MSESVRPPSWLSEAAERAKGLRAIGWRQVTRGGYTPAARWVATFEGGETAFVKGATTELLAGWLRREHEVCTSLEADFVPRVVGWDDEGKWPVLLLEDLSAGHWPPPWTPEMVSRVRATLERVAEAEVPGVDLEEGSGLLSENGWAEVARDPGPFLSLGVWDEGRLMAALPALMEAEAAARRDGSDLLHLDVRSDNICFAPDGSVVLVDWNCAAHGDRRVDLAFWLPSLAYEGGSPPEEVFPDAGPYAALVAGFFAARAGLPDIPNAPFVRRVQREQLSTALPWAMREVGRRE